MPVDIGEEEEEPEEEEDDKESEEEDDEREFADMDSSDGKTGGRVSSSSSSHPSLDARAQLASNLLLLHGTELGHVMSLLEREFPKALLSLKDEEVGGGTESQVPAQIPEKFEINLDELDSSIFQKISKYATERASGRKRGMAGGDVELEDVSGKRKRKR